MRRSPFAPRTRRFAARRVFACEAEALVVLLTALAAATAAHLAIDVAGDYLLPRDAYDGVAHHSRALAFAACAAAAIAALLRLIGAASAEARGGADAFSATVGRIAARGLGTFAPLVAVAALGALGAMEAFDALLDGAHVDDAADLFGGSLVVGPAISIAIAACAAAIVLQTFRALAGARTSLIRAVGCALAALLTSSPARPLDRIARTETIVHGRLRFARSNGKRGPPLLAAS